MTPSVPAPLDMGAVLREVRTLPPLPELVFRLIQSLDDPDTNLEKLEKQIEMDQVLAARLLRIANSSFYGLSRKVGTVRDATVVLGFGTLRSMVIGMSAISHFNSLRFPEGFGYQTFWRHGLATGLAAEQLARAKGEPEGLAFTAGLIHDIGRLVVAAKFPDHWQACQDCKREKSLSLLEAEDEVLGVSHPKIGAALMRHWQFPAPVIDAIEFHHQPQLARMPVAHTVHLADGLARHQIRLDPAGAVVLDGHLSPESWSHHGVRAAALPALLETLENKMSMVDEVLRVGTGGGV